MRINNKFIIPALLILALGFVEIAGAQSCCGRVALPGGGIDQRPLLKGQIDFRITYENSLLNRTLLGKDIIDDPLDRWNRTQIAHAGISYGFSERLTGTLVVPVKWAKLSLIDNRVSRETSGLGDIVGLAKFRLTAPVSPRDPEIALGAGIKIPIGKYEDSDFYGTLSSSQQVGSGAFDLISALYYNQLFNPVLIHSSALFRYPTENKREYRFGPELELRGKIIYPDIMNRISPWMGFRGRFAGRDSYGGSPLDSYGGGAFRDSGGEWVYATPGFEIRLAKEIAVAAELEFPVYNNVNGRQISESLIWRVSTALNGLI